MALDPHTVALLKEAYAGQVCCGCGYPAQRYFDSRYFCHDCVVNRRKVTPLTLRPVKTHHPRGSSPNDPRRQR